MNNLKHDDLHQAAKDIASFQSFFRKILILLTKGATEQNVFMMNSFKRTKEMKKEGNKRADDFFKNVKVFCLVQVQAKSNL